MKALQVALANLRDATKPIDAADRVILLNHIESLTPRRAPEDKQFALVLDRNYEGEGYSLAVWNGENYNVTDGDCFEREGDTLDGYTAEFLTDYQLEQKLETLRKALRGLERMYSDAWDGVGGGLVILDIPRFEAAHKAAHKAARIALGTPLFDLDTGEMEA